MSVELVVFSDDWGRHPSSCQHLVRHLLARHRTLWVNTVGTRPPRLSLSDVQRVVGRLRSPGRAAALPENLRVISPWMYPGFRSGWQRRLNAKLLTDAIHAALGARLPGVRRVAITTLPITADLVGRLDVDRWVYYCVDDFSVWPGLDGSVMDEMERSQAVKMDAVVAVSQTLAQRLGAMGCPRVELLTHGIDMEHWKLSEEVSGGVSGGAGGEYIPGFLGGLGGPLVTFWGVVDQRLDAPWCLALVEAMAGTLLLLGPQQSPDARLLKHPRIHAPGPVPYAQLPSVARASAVLVMPYADLPVTRAIQPLKFKEYLATGRPVVVRSLPATVEWSDAADVVRSEAEFVARVQQRTGQPTPTSQLTARARLSEESWSAKARVLETHCFCTL